MTWSQPTAPLPAAVRRRRRRRSQNLPIRTLILKLFDGSLLNWQVTIGPVRPGVSPRFADSLLRLVVVALLATATAFVFLALLYAVTTKQEATGTSGVASDSAPVAASQSSPDRPPVAASDQAASAVEVAAPGASEPAAVTLAQPAAPAHLASVQLQIPNNKQERTLNCEFRSATDLAAYYGKHFSWEQLFEIVGYDPSGDPNKGFAGRSVDDPPGGLYPSGYGVYAEPVARGLRQLGVNATAHQGQTVEWIKQKLSEGHPVMVWAVAYMDVTEPVEWQTTDGVTVRGVPFEHTFNVVGYDESGVLVNDPYTATTDSYSWEKFQASWGVLGNMALTIEETPAN